MVIGTKVIAREYSRESKPTLEIQKHPKKIKYRYREGK